MKQLLFLLIILPAISNAQNDTVSSKLYQKMFGVIDAEVTSKPGILFEGKTHDFEWMKMSVYTAKQIKQGSDKVPPNEEHLLIVISGSATITIKDSSTKIGRGSVAMLLPNEQYSLTSPDRYPNFTYYILAYRSKLPMDMERGIKAGGSFVMDWNKIKFNPHDRGGVRNYFNRATAMSSRFEMHVTTLNAGIKSHEPHTHRASEIVLMIEGNTEMQIGQSFHKGTDGDMYFLGTNVLHGVRNIGTKPCMYFAFQFE